MCVCVWEFNKFIWVSFFTCHLKKNHKSKHYMNLNKKQNKIFNLKSDYYYFFNGICLELILLDMFLRLNFWIRHVLLFMNHCKQALNLSLFAVNAFHAMASFSHAMLLKNRAQWTESSTRLPMSITAKAEKRKKQSIKPGETKLHIFTSNFTCSVMITLVPFWWSRIFTRSCKGHRDDLMATRCPTMSPSH